MLLLKANLNLLTALEIVEVAGLAAGEAPDHLDSDTGVALTTRAANEPSEMVLQGPYAYTTRVREADKKVISNKGWAGWLA